MAKLTPPMKQDIIKKFEEGVKISQIAQCYDVDPAAICYVIKNYQKFGNNSLAVKYVDRKKLTDMNAKDLELYHLKKENKKLKLELEIRKQISTFFKSQNPKNN